MKLSVWPLLAASSLMLGMAQSATRPQYGGTLRVVMSGAPPTLDPADSADAGFPEQQNLARLLFDTLVSTDDAGRARPALAVSWQAEAGNRRWQFRLRPGVLFEDGSALTADVAASSVRAANPTWNIYSTSDSLVIELDAPAPALLAELALARNSVVRNSPRGMSGTGPFRVAEWQPGKKAVLVANESHWRGRPYLDSIQIQFGIHPREAALQLELGQADLIEIPPELARKASTEGRRVSASAPIAAIALVFARDPQSPDERKLREALGWSINRGSIRDVLFQGEGDPAGGILPRWIGGYEFLFPAGYDLARARQQAGEVRQKPSWTLGYDSADPLSRLAAERIALNARDAGIVLQPAPGAAGVRLLRVVIPSLDPALALPATTRMMGVAVPRLNAASADELYRAENSLLESGRVIPLFHLPLKYGLSVNVRNWGQRQDGLWNLGDVWMGKDIP